jgi:hypothetical protein
LGFALSFFGGYVGGKEKKKAKGKSAEIAGLHSDFRRFGLCP